MNTAKQSTSTSQSVPDRESVGSLVRRRRKAASLTQRQLAELVGTGTRLISVPPGPAAALPAPDGPTLRPGRLAWPELLQRVFAVDVLECPRCGRRMRLLAAIQPPDVTQAILECLDLPSRAPPAAPAHPDG